MIISSGQITQKGKKSISSATSSLVTMCGHSLYISKKKKDKRFSISFVFIFLSGALNLGLISSSWLALLPLSFPVSSFYYPKAKVHNVSDGSFDWDSEGEY